MFKYEVELCEYGSKSKKYIIIEANSNNEACELANSWLNNIWDAYEYSKILLGKNRLRYHGEAISTLTISKI